MVKVENMISIIKSEAFIFLDKKLKELINVIN